MRAVEKIFWKKKNNNKNFDLSVVKIANTSLYLISHNFASFSEHWFSKNRFLGWKRSILLLKSSVGVRFGFGGKSLGSGSVRQIPKVRVRSVTTPKFIWLIIYLEAFLLLPLCAAFMRCIKYTIWIKRRLNYSRLFEAKDFFFDKLYKLN